MCTEKKYVEYFKAEGFPIIKIVATDGYLLKVEFLQESKDIRIDRGNNITRKTKHQLGQYLNGNREIFDIPFLLDKINASLAQYTNFQKEVWSELQQIPYGEKVSYSELAKRVGNPKACRAVGTANGKNPLPIIIPCHRVIAADGSIGGYTGGIEIKKKLLEIEGIKT
ncbi:MAG: methylated-DNA--[protein]-cysteine S-methyltransferase [Anaerovoracaceae bacterium]